MNRNRVILGRVYFALFLAYLMVPLIVMSGAAFNDSKLPTVAPWKGFTWAWFHELWADQTMWGALVNSILVALAVVALAVPMARRRRSSSTRSRGGCGPRFTVSWWRRCWRRGW